MVNLIYKLAGKNKQTNKPVYIIKIKINVSII